LAARRESDAGSARKGREDSGGDGNGTRRGAVEGRSVLWCVPGTAGGHGRRARRLGRVVQTRDAGRDAGSRRSARPPGGAGPGEGGRPRTCSRSGTKYGLGRAGSPVPTRSAPGPPAPVPPVVPAVHPAGPTPAPTPPVALALAAQEAPAAPTPAPTPPAAPAPASSEAPAAKTPASTHPTAPAPAAPEAPAGPNPAAAAAPPVPIAPVPPVRAPPGPGAVGGPLAPAARLQRWANHSRSSCEERSSRLDEGLREATRADSAPPGSAPPSSAPPDPVPRGSAPPGSAPPSSAPPDSAPPDAATLDSAPLAAPESTATSTGSTASTWDTPDGAGP
ncbi:unnamed protein product, partial [Closterium sp. NIES-54]